MLFGTGMPRNVAGTRLLNFTKTGGNSKPGSNDFSTLMNLVMMVLDALTEIFEWIGIQSSALSFGKGPELFVFFSVLGFFFGFPVLAICGILELEGAISTVFAAFLSSNISCSMEFATFWC